MSIRKAVVTDAIEIKKLVASLSHYYLENSSASLPQWFSNTLEIAEFEQRLSSSEFIHYVYIQNNIIVGYIAIKVGSHVYHLFVSEACQGQGIARKLWAWVETKLTARVITVRSSVYAVPVYKAFGFQASGLSASKEGIGFQAMELTR